MPSAPVGTRPSASPGPGSSRQQDRQTALPVESDPPKGSFKDALLAQIRTTKSVFYNTVVAQAQTIEVTADRVTFTFSATQKALREMFEQHRAWLESLAQQVAGRKVTVASGNGAEGQAAGATREASQAPAPDRKAALRDQALADAGLQALLEVFPAEIRDVEEM